jgi:hypothetical protein
MSRLQAHEITTWLAAPPKKGELLDGYKIAQDPRKWQEEQDRIARVAAEEAADAEVDELDDDAEKVAAAAAAAKKRKRSSAAADTESPAPKASATKSAGKKDTAAAAKGKKGAAARARKANGKSRALVESEDDAERADADGDADGADDAGPSKTLNSPPPAKKKKSDKDDPSACPSYFFLGSSFGAFCSVSLAHRLCFTSSMNGADGGGLYHASSSTLRMLGSVWRVFGAISGAWGREPLDSPIFLPKTTLRPRYVSRGPSRASLWRPKGIRTLSARLFGIFRRRSCDMFSIQVARRFPGPREPFWLAQDLSFSPTAQISPNPYISLTPPAPQSSRTTRKRRRSRTGGTRCRRRF